MRVVTCRYLRRHGDQCTAEALDPTADTLLCLKHAASVIVATGKAREIAFGADLAERIERDAEAQRERAELAKVAGLVYYAAVWGHIKIGTTVNIENRMAELHATRVLATEPGSYDIEAQRHRQFAHLRVVGEYFHTSPELLAHTEAVCAEHGPPITSTATQISLARTRSSSSRGEASDDPRLGPARLAAALRSR